VVTTVIKPVAMHGATDRRNPYGEEGYPCHVDVRVRAGDHAGGLRGVGFSQLSHMRVIEREPMLTGILKVVKLPPQSTFRRFLASLGISDRRADSSGATGHAAEGVGGDPRGTERGHAGYRHHGACLIIVCDWEG
jgi:hypothetical protein